MGLRPYEAMCAQRIRTSSDATDRAGRPNLRNQKRGPAAAVACTDADGPKKERRGREERGGPLRDGAGTPQIPGKGARQRKSGSPPASRVPALGLKRLGQEGSWP